MKGTNMEQDALVEVCSSGSCLMGLMISKLRAVPQPVACKDSGFEAVIVPHYTGGGQPGPSLPLDPSSTRAITCVNFGT